LTEAAKDSEVDAEAIDISLELIVAAADEVIKPVPCEGLYGYRRELATAAEKLKKSLSAWT
jgi:hypothetical protein